MKFRITLHRIVAWWLAVFAMMTILTGYAAGRKWGENHELLENLHIIIKWAFLLLMLYHVTYTFLYVRFKGALRREPKKHWLRILQQITKWLILAFTLLTVITGFSYYQWAQGVLPEWLLHKVHTVFDIGLSLSIITHVLVGFRMMLKRNKINKLWVDILLVTIGAAISIFFIILEARPPY